MRVGDWPLVGRREELDLLEGLVGSGSGSVVVAGGLGVGKSRLTGDLLARLAARGIRTVLVRATRATATIPFGPFALWARDLPAGTGRSATDRLQVLRVIARELLEGDDPVVVAVDDAHLLDEGSAALLLYLAAHTPAGLVVTVRTGEPCLDAVVALWKEGLAEVVPLHALTERETVALVERVLQGPLEAAGRQRLWRLTTGTPLYLREVLRAAREQDVLAEVDGCWRWRGDLGGSGRLAELLGDRLDRLEAGERRLLELVAIGEPLALDLAAALDPECALVDAEHHGLVEVAEDAAGRPTLRLAHPLYGEVLRTSVPVLTSREHLRTLAAAAVAAGWHQREPLRVASWWLDAGAMPGPADVFAAGARHALTLAEWGLADRLGQAAETSGAGAEATLVRAVARVQTGGWRQADELLAGLDHHTLEGDLLAEHARLAAGSLAWGHGRPGAGRTLLVDTAGRLRGPARARVLVDAAYMAVLSLDPASGDRLAVEAMNEAGPMRDLRVQALAVAGLAWVLRGRVRAARRAAEMAAPLLLVAATPDPYPGSSEALLTPAHCLALAFEGRLDDAAALAEARLGEPVDGDDDRTRPLLHSLAAHVALLGGRLDEALGHGAAALAGGGPGPATQWPAGVLAAAAAQVGDESVAEEALARADATAPAVPLYAPVLALGRAWLRAVGGDLGGAQAVAREAAGTAARAGVPLLELMALVELGRLGAAGAAAGRLAELAAVVDGPFAVAAAAWAGAAAVGDGEGLDEAADRFAAMGALLLAAETAAGAAAAHLAAGGRDLPRRSVARARALAPRCGGARTPGLAEIEADPLLATLTSREREVVDLAAGGLNNREIAFRLFVSIRTVNAHLRQAYAKLGTNDRARLAALLPPVPQPD